MTGLLKDKVCIVTGAARGIGKETALLLAEEGAHVIVNDVREGSADQWIKESHLKDSLEAVYFDITDGEQIRNKLLIIKKKYRQIDVLVNNAGIEFNEAIGMITKENTGKMFQVNVWGTIQMLQNISRIMKRNPEGGSIINIASMVGLRGNAGQLGYAATKGAVIALTKSAAKELAASGIRVNAIAPGFIETDMTAELNEKQIEAIKGELLIGRLGQVEDIAKFAAFLASDAASYITGQVIGVDGGMML